MCISLSALEAICLLAFLRELLNRFDKSQCYEIIKAIRSLSQKYEVTHVDR